MGARAERAAVRSAVQPAGSASWMFAPCASKARRASRSPASAASRSWLRSAGIGGDSLGERGQPPAWRFHFAAWTAVSGEAATSSSK